MSEIGFDRKKELVYKYLLEGDSCLNRLKIIKDIAQFSSQGAEILIKLVEIEPISPKKMEAAKSEAAKRPPGKVIVSDNKLLDGTFKAENEVLNFDNKTALLKF